MCMCFVLEIRDKKKKRKKHFTVGLKYQKIRKKTIFDFFFSPIYFVWQPGFGYQQQLVPGMRPGGAPMPNFFVPMVPQGQQGQRPGGRRTGAGPVQQAQQPVPMLQQQV